MKVVKIILLGVLVVVLVGSVATVASSRGMLKTPGWVAKIPKSIPQFKLPQASLPPEAQQQVTILSDRTKSLSGHVGQVLGSYIQESEHKEPLHQRTFEYARYMYCQQVIKDYQSVSAPSSSPSSVPTPSPTQP